MKTELAGPFVPQLVVSTKAPGEVSSLVPVLPPAHENVGLTPKNKYHVYVDKETMMVGQWSYYRDASDTEPQFTRPWRNWQRYGNVMLSNNRGEGRGGSPFILPNVGIYDTVPASAFEDPARLDLATLADQ